MSPEGSADACFQLEQRVLSLKADKSPQLGVVKYIGPVDGYEGVWIGVDWESGQGRHSGTVNGKHYFETKSKDSGSFVRPNSLSTGITFAEALTQRYNASAAPKTSGDDDMYIMSVRQRRMTVELVGKDQIVERQKRLEDLKTVSLAYAGVSSVGPRGQVGTLAPGITELDLTGNLLPNWLEVGHICEELPSLKVLNLSLSCLDIPLEGNLPVLSNIKTIVLNSCHITWKQVELLKHSLSSVEELHLCGNGIKKIEGSGLDDSCVTELFIQGFESLRFLNLEDNAIESWGEIIKLSKLRRLEHLNLNSNSLNEIVYPDQFLSCSLEVNKQGGELEGEECVPFQNLNSLLLGKNKITGLASVDALNHFPSLKELRLSENPITNPASGGIARYMLIARIGNITSLNGSEVKARERRDAEIRYVRYVLSTSVEENNEVLNRLHPRFLELRSTHDVPVESVLSEAALVSKKMSASLLSVTIMCVSLSVGEKAAITKKLPRATTVGKLKQICEGLFKLRPAKQCLYIKDQDPLPIPLENDLETLEDLGLGPNAVILVDEAQGH